MADRKTDRKVGTDRKAENAAECGNVWQAVKIVVNGFKLDHLNNP